MITNSPTVFLDFNFPFIEGLAHPRAKRAAKQLTGAVV
jgi:hypothetical protein